MMKTQYPNSNTAKSRPLTSMSTSEFKIIYHLIIWNPLQTASPQFYFFYINIILDFSQTISPHFMISDFVFFSISRLAPYPIPDSIFNIEQLEAVDKHIVIH